jgi:hypothetical protein
MHGFWAELAAASTNQACRGGRTLLLKVEEPAGICCRIRLAGAYVGVGIRERHIHHQHSCPAEENQMVSRRAGQGRNGRYQSPRFADFLLSEFSLAVQSGDAVAHSFSLTKLYLIPQVHYSTTVQCRTSGANSEDLQPFFFSAFSGPCHLALMCAYCLWTRSLQYLGWNGCASFLFKYICTSQLSGTILSLICPDS